MYKRKPKFVLKNSSSFEYTYIGLGTYLFNSIVGCWPLLLQPFEIDVQTEKEA